MRKVALALGIAISTFGCHSSPPTTGTHAERAPRIACGELDQAVIGERVSIRGRVTRVQDDSPYGHKLWLDDGSGEAQVFIDASTDLIRYTNAWRTNDELDVTGTVAKYNSLWELLPKAAPDIVVLSRATD